MKKMYGMLCLLLLLTAGSYAGELLRYDFGPDEDTGTLLPAVEAEYVNGLAFSGGPGLTDVKLKEDAGADGAAYTGENWVSVLDDTKYFQFGVVVEEGQVLDIASISLVIFKKSGKGPDSFQIRYSTDGGTFEDFGDNQSADYEDIWKPVTVSHVVSELSGTIYFRIYGYEAGGIDKRWRIDNVVLNGTVYSGSANIPSVELNPSGLNHTLEVGKRFEMRVSALEADGDIVTLESKNLPEGSVFIPSTLTGVSPLQQMFYWTPTETGQYTVVFAASDQDGSNRIDVVLDVGPAQPEIALIVNEYNGVSGDKFLGSDYLFETNCADSFFGRIQGNGKNWVELVVVKDHADLRGWQLRWAEPGDPLIDPDTGEVLWQSTGEDLWYGAANGVNGVNVKQGILEFSDSEYWSDLRAGTIITIIESETVINEWGSQCLDGSDLSYDPRSGDWWIHISTLAEQASMTPLITTSVNIAGEDPGEFGVGNDDWEMTVYDAGGERNFGPVGEAVAGWGGGSASSKEGVMAVASPQDIVNSVYFDDTKWTTFGSINTWGDGADGQDFEDVREDVLIPPRFVEFGDQTVYVGDTFRLTVNLYNTDSNAVSMSLLNAPSGMTFEAGDESATLEWEPTVPNTYSVLLSAADLDGSNTKSFNVYVEQPPVEGTLLINEVFANPVGEDGNREYVEIRGPAGASLNGVSLLMLDSGGASIGRVRIARDLTGYSLGSNGLLLLGENYESYPPYTNIPADTLVLNLYGGEELSDEGTYLLVNGFYGSVEDDLDTNDDGILDSAPWSSLLDSMGMAAAMEGYRIYSTVRLLVSEDTPDAASRLPSNGNASDWSAWYFGGTTEEPGDPYGLVYKQKDSSVFLPPGARLTPGAPNVDAQTGGDGDADGDGMPDDWEIAMFGSTAPDANGDYDGDGESNIQEYICGTDAASSSSGLFFDGGEYATLPKGGGSTSNLLANPGFELAGSTADFAYYWQESFPDANGMCWGNSGRRNWASHSGSWSMALTGYWLFNANNAGMLRRVPCTAGETFEANAWFYREAIWNYTTRLKLEFMSGSLTLLHAVTNDATSLPAAEWHELTVSADAPANAAYAQLVVEAIGITGDSGSMFVDDVELLRPATTTHSSSFVLSWQAVTGCTYSVDWRNDLLEGSWTALTNAQNVSVGENGPVEIKDEFEASQQRRLYRLNIQR